MHLKFALLIPLFSCPGPPLIDTVLEPGEGLYLPLGFAHITSTDNDYVDYAGGRGRGHRSIHFTMGVSEEPVSMQKLATCALIR